MEATGNYSALLLYMLNVAGITVSMENPLKVKNFARAMLSTVKTDKIDARLIALYGEKMNPQPFKVQGEAILRLRQKRTVIRQLTKQITAMSNLRGSLACLPVPDKGATHTVDETIKFLEKRRDRLQSELTDLVEVEFSRQLALLTTIKGIGITLATALILTTGGFTYFQNAKQVSRYLGICPTYEQSGTSVNIRGHINRNGDAYTRGLLYIAAWPASRFNAQCKETYTRLRQNGKPGKLAMIAVANKLVRQAFAVVAHDKEYIDGFVSNRP
jgi:transposase